jgi:hypothetical protein
VIFFLLDLGAVLITVPKSNKKNKKYHTIRTAPKSNKKKYHTIRTDGVIFFF